jgi:anti-sigma factor RsiW
MSEPTNTNDLAYEKLVAYLDGELDAETSQQVERRLAEDPGYRHELKQMQRAWDLLDELPRAEVSETFTQTTVEMVALSAEHELKDVKSRVRHFDRLVWVAVGASVVLAGVAAFWGVSTYFSRPNDQLARDLPVIENVELYEVADSVEFLRELERTGYFKEESDDEL